MGWRLRRAGWKTRFEPAATVFHVGSAATKKAFGEDLWARWMAATYGWMARERGVLVAWSVALINLGGATARLLLFGALACLAPRRYGPIARRSREWARVHRTGLRSRRELLREH